MRHISKQSLLIVAACLSAGLFISVAVLTPGFIPKNIEAQSSQVTSSTTPSRLSNYAWSENIGWISFMDGSQPVTVAPNGLLTGYAWSEHVGWVQFGGLTGFPNSSNGTNAQFDGDTLKGWARVVSGTAPSAGADNRGDFDGWISLSGSNYGVTRNGNTLSGFAWGSDVVGWVDFSGVTIKEMLRSCSGPYGVIIPDGSSFTFFSTPKTNGSCDSEVRTCSDGVLSPGAYSELGCSTRSTCTRGGKVYQDGEEGTFYLRSFVGSNQTCEEISTDLTCTDGIFVDADGNENKTHYVVRCGNTPNFKEF